MGADDVEFTVADHDGFPFFKGTDALQNPFHDVSLRIGTANSRSGNGF